MEEEGSLEKIMSEGEKRPIVQEGESSERKGKGGGRWMITSEEEEELTTYEDESGRKKKQRRGRGNLGTKRKLKEGKRNRRMEDSEQTDITKDEWSDKEEVMEETGGRRRQEVGKDRAIKGARTEAKYEQELNGMTP